MTFSGVTLQNHITSVSHPPAVTHDSTKELQIESIQLWLKQTFENINSNQFMTQLKFTNMDSNQLMTPAKTIDLWVDSWFSSESNTSLPKGSPIVLLSWHVFFVSFKWAHLNERLRFERAVRQDRLRTEVALAKKEANFYLENVERSERQAQRRQRLEASGKQEAAAGKPALPFNQRLTTAEILKQKGMTEGREERLGAMRVVGLFGNKNAPPDEGKGEWCGRDGSLRQWMSWMWDGEVIDLKSASSSNRHGRHALGSETLKFRIQILTMIAMTQCL